MTQPTEGLSRKWFPANLEQQGFAIRRVFKASERFVTAVITDGQHDYVFKQVLEPDSGKATGVEGFDFAQYLLMEGEVLKFLELHQAALAGNSPKLLDVKAGVKHAYYVRELVPNARLAVPGSNFFFSDNFAKLLPADGAAAYFASLGELTEWLPDNLRDALAARRFVMSLQQLRSAIRQPLEVRPQLAGLHDAIMELFGEWRPRRKPAPLVITHGEPYPPHWYSAHGNVGLIDWENAQLDDRYSDLVAVYIRAFRDKDWQRQLIEAAEVDEGSILWRGALLFQSLLNLPYLSLEEREPVELRHQGLDYLEKLIISLVK